MNRAPTGQRCRGAIRALGSLAIFLLGWALPGILRSMSPSAHPALGPFRGLVPVRRKQRQPVLRARRRDEAAARPGDQGERARHRPVRRGRRGQDLPAARRALPDPLQAGRRLRLPRQLRQLRAGALGGAGACPRRAADPRRERAGLPGQRGQELARWHAAGARPPRGTAGRGRQRQRRAGGARGAAQAGAWPARAAACTSSCASNPRASTGSSACTTSPASRPPPAAGTSWPASTKPKPPRSWRRQR